MASAMDELKQKAVQEFSVDEAEVEGMSTDDLTNLVLGKFAQKEYKVDSAEIEGKSNPELIEVLVRSMVSDVLKKEASEITSESSFKDLGADSLDMVELLMRIEDVVRLFGDTKIDEYISKSVTA